MGRDGRGVRAVSDSSIEITFMYRGGRCRERISLKPTATNLKLAERHKAAIEHAIANGTFDYDVTFPGSPRAAKFAPEASQETLAGFLTKWLAAKKQHVSSSTFAGYRKIVEQRLVPVLGPTLLIDLKRRASIKRTTRCLIEWQLHTMTRPAEAATTRWADIDVEKKVWTIPAERMKKRRIPIVPLTDQVLALLEAIKPYSGHREYVFPADRNPRTHCNSQTANMALKRMGFEGRLVSHGMRSMASTILNEHAWDPELIEVALAHVDKDEVRSAYNRADYIERRRPMMDWWSKHIQEAATGSPSVSALCQNQDRKVVSIR